MGIHCNLSTFTLNDNKRDAVGVVLFLISESRTHRKYLVWKMSIRTIYTFRICVEVIESVLSVCVSVYLSARVCRSCNVHDFNGTSLCCAICVCVCVNLSWQKDFRATVQGGGRGKTIDATVFSFMGINCEK